MTPYAYVRVDAFGHCTTLWYQRNHLMCTYLSKSVHDTLYITCPNSSFRVSGNGIWDEGVMENRSTQISADG